MSMSRLGYKEANPTSRKPTMATLYSATIGLHRKKPRIYLHSSRLVDEGWSIGENFSVKQGKDNNLKLVVEESGARTVSRKKKTKKDEFQPLIDLREDDLMNIGKVGSKIRIFVHSGVMIFSKHFQDRKIADRIVSLLDNMSNLNTTSFFHGAGIASRALHEGMKKVGVKTRLAFVLEREREYLECSLRNNSVMFDKDSVVVNAELKDVDFLSGDFPTSNIFEAGIPCTVHAKCNTANTSNPEAVEEGVSFFSTLSGIQKMNPAIIQLECVVEFGRSQSAEIIRTCLSSWGYLVKESHLSGPDFGSFERRTRWFCLAVSKGLEEFIDFDDLKYEGPNKPENFGVIRDKVVPDDQWKPYTYLRDKELRDIEAGKGFRMHIINDDNEHCNVLTRYYSKAQSTGVLVEHPDPSSELLRLFSITEQAKAKTIPVELVDGLGKTLASQALGQSVIYRILESIGSLIGNGINNHFSANKSIAA